MGIFSRHNDSVIPDNDILGSAAPACEGGSHDATDCPMPDNDILPPVGDDSETDRVDAAEHQAADAAPDETSIAAGSPDADKL